MLDTYSSACHEGRAISLELSLALGRSVQQTARLGLGRIYSDKVSSNPQVGRKSASSRTRLAVLALRSINDDLKACPVYPSCGLDASD